MIRWYISQRFAIYWTFQNLIEFKHMILNSVQFDSRSVLHCFPFFAALSNWAIYLIWATCKFLSLVLKLTKKDNWNNFCQYLRYEKRKQIFIFWCFFSFKLCERNKFQKAKIRLFQCFNLNIVYDIKPKRLFCVYFWLNMVERIVYCDPIIITTQFCYESNEETVINFRLIQK